MSRSSTEQDKKKRLVDIEGRSKSLRRSQYATDSDMEEAGCSQAEDDANEKRKPHCSSGWSVNSRAECRLKSDGSFVEFRRRLTFECTE